MGDRRRANAVGGLPRATGEPWLWDGTADAYRNSGTLMQAFGPVTKILEFPERIQCRATSGISHPCLVVCLGCNRDSSFATSRNKHVKRVRRDFAESSYGVRGGHYVAWTFLQESRQGASIALAIYCRFLAIHDIAVH